MLPPREEHDADSAADSPGDGGTEARLPRDIRGGGAAAPTGVPGRPPSAAPGGGIQNRHCVVDVVEQRAHTRGPDAASSAARCSGVSITNRPPLLRGRAARRSMVGAALGNAFGGAPLTRMIVVVSPHGLVEAAAGSRAGDGTPGGTVRGAEHDVVEVTTAWRWSPRLVPRTWR